MDAATLTVLLTTLLLGGLPGAGTIGADDLPGSEPDAASQLAPESLPEPAAAQAVPTLSASARVSLISILPGDDLYSLFGHSMLRVRDPVLGIDRAYNFGTFDFGESPFAMAAFVARFAYGDLYYRLSVQDPVARVRAYWRNLGRASIEQTLDLTGAERQELFRRLEINALPENRYYQYDFFFDNCATRLIDVLEAAVGPGLSFDVAPPGRSFRQLLDPYLAGTPWVDFWMDLGLGMPADRMASAREATFLPEHLMESFAAGRVERGAGRVDRGAGGLAGAGDRGAGADAGGSRPLVSRTETLTGPAGASWKPPSEPPWPAITLWILLAAGLAITVLDVRAARPSRRIVDAVLFGILGVAGLAVVFLWFISLHDVTRTNFNLGWALPTHLWLAGALAAGSRARRVGIYLAATAALAALLLAGMPMWPQELPAAIIPLLLLIVARAGGLSWVRLSRPASRPSPP